MGEGGKVLWGIKGHTHWAIESAVDDQLYRRSHQYRPVGMALKGGR